MNIHPSAIVNPSASIGEGVKIGPYCIVDGEVTLENSVELKSHVVVTGRTEIGNGTVIYPFASIGQPPQILKYKGEKSRVIIGKNNVIREYVTIQAGSTDGGMVTRIGDGGLFMVGVHIGHDCLIGNNIVFANYVSLAGHVEVGDFVVIGGLAAVHQFVRIGSYAMVGGVSALVRDLIPFGLAVGDRAHLEGINLVGMKRRGFDNNAITTAKVAIDKIFATSGILADRIDQASEEFADNKAALQILDFMKADTTRNFCQPKK